MFGFFGRKPRPENFLPPQEGLKNNAKADFLAGFDVGEKLPAHEGEILCNKLEQNKFSANVALESRGKEEEGWINQDACIDLQEGRIIGVFDGVGSSGRGDIASSIGKKTLRECYAKSNIVKDIMTAERQMKDMMLQANSRIRIEQRASSENSNISTTFVGSEVWINKENGEPMLTVGNSGDSVAYLFREGKLEKISKEHSFVSFLNDSFILNIDDQDDKVLSVTLSDYVKNNNIPENPQLSRILDMVIRSNRKAGEMTIGSLRNVTYGGLSGKNIDDREMDISTIKLETGDKILLCTDGLTDSTTEADIEKIILDNESKGSEFIKKALIEKGISAQTDENNRRANKKDDITVAWIDFKGFEELEILINEEDLEEVAAA